MISKPNLKLNLKLDRSYTETNPRTVLIQHLIHP